MTRRRTNAFFACLFSMLLIGLALPAAAELPDPDGKPADMTKPVQVYILLGQSNMVGFGGTKNLKTIAPDKYPYLVNDAGNYTVRQDVRNVFIMASGNNIGKIQHNNWLTIDRGRIGPEIGIGHYVGEHTDAPVLILKSCIGNRSLGWDLLPPGVEAYEHGGKLHPGYRGTPDDPKGDTGGDMSKGWYAGCQYDGDVKSAKHVLENLDKFYPGAKEYEVKGFFWWQGCKDKGNAAHAERYGMHLAYLLRALRKDFNAPNAFFVGASIGETKEGKGGNEGKMMEGLMALANSDEEEFKDKAGFVYSHPLVLGGGSCGHYGNNVQAYMNVGEAMGKEMVRLLEKNGGSSASGRSDGGSENAPAEPIDHEMRTWTGTNGSSFTAKFIEASRSKVVLELENGRKRSYSKRAFTEEDIAYIEKYAR
ncbi:MAG: sialate O-acetylesterase [Planctomycetota bacterium]